MPTSSKRKRRIILYDLVTRYGPETNYQRKRLSSKLSNTKKMFQVQTEYIQKVENSTFSFPLTFLIVTSTKIPFIFLVFFNETIRKFDYSHYIISIDSISRNELK